MPPFPPVPAWLKGLIPLAVLSALYWQADWELFGTVLANARWDLAGMVLAIELLAMALQGLRWRLLAGPTGARIPFWRVQEVNLMASFYDLFIPGKVGSDLFRAVRLGGNGHTHQAVGALFMLRVQGFMMLFLLFAVAIPLRDHGARWFMAPLALGLAILLPLLATTLLRWGEGTLGWLARPFPGLTPLHRLMGKVEEAYRGIAGDCRRLLVTSSLALLTALVNCAAFALAGRAMGVEMPFPVYLTDAPVLLVLGMVPLTVQGRGLTELAALFLWLPLGASPERILLLCLLVFAASLATSLLGGLLYGHEKWRARRPLDQEQEEPRCAS